MAMQTDLDMTYKNKKSLHVTDCVITCIPILTWQDFNWRLWKFSKLFLIGYLIILWVKNATFKVPIKHKSLCNGVYKLTDNYN